MSGSSGAEGSLEGDLQGEKGKEEVELEVEVEAEVGALPQDNLVLHTSFVFIPLRTFSSVMAFYL